MADIAHICLIHGMQALESLFKSFGRRRPARWWIGKTPDERQGQLPRAIAARIDYPTAAEDPFLGNGIVKLNDRQAAHALAVAGTVGLAHGFDRPKPSWRREAYQALSQLGEDRSFFSNGLWETLRWTPMTSATFDCGLIGFDSRWAFIFWVEEED